MKPYKGNIDSEHKWYLLKDMPLRDSRNPKLIELAGKIWDIALGRKLTFLKLALAVARDGISFESDIKQFGHEDIAGVTRYPEPNDAIEAYVRGHDDCDAKARLFVALCLAQGFEARLWPLWKHGQLTHVAAEVLVRGKWIHAETILARARLGEFHTDVPLEPKTGKWKVSE